MKFSRVLALLVALFTTVLFVGLGVVRFHEETATHRPVVPPYEIFWCQTDEDCAVVDRMGCCSCREGGAHAAVTKWRRDDLEDFLEGACRPMSAQVCVQVDLCRRDLVAKCEDRRCTLAVKTRD